MKKIMIVMLMCFLSLLSAQSSLPPPSLYDVNSHYTQMMPTEDTRHRYIWGSTGILLASAVVSAGLLYLMPSSFTNWNKKDFNDLHLLSKRWRRNVKKSPVVDKDGAFLNLVTHPYWGAVYYMQPRVAGYDWTDSVLYSVIASTFFWEYGVEAFAEVPSWQDLVITPAVGSVLGEIFYRLTRLIQENNHQVLGSPFLGSFSLALMDPLRVIMQDKTVTQWLGIKNQYEFKNHHEFSSYFVPEKRGIRWVVLRQF